MNPMYPTMGYNYGYNPYMMQQQQQRLADYEQQYPQFANNSPNNNLNNLNGANAINNNNPMVNTNTMNNYVKCRAVTSIDEAKASMIDLDGSIHVFTDIGNKKIYTKQINLDGTATLNTYSLDGQTEKTTEAPQPQQDLPYVKQEELEAVCRSFNGQIMSLEEKLDEYEKAFARQEEALQKMARETTKGGKK